MNSDHPHGGRHIEASAPGRCGLVGNPSDMYSGTVISCSIQERAYCRIEVENPIRLDAAKEWFDRPSEDSSQQSRRKYSISLGDSSQEIVSQKDLALDGGSLDLVKAAITSTVPDFDSLPSFSLSASSDIPRQSGLAGSTALLAALIGALNALVGRKVDPYTTAEMVRACEFDQMKTLCGFQDAYMAVFGGLNYMDFRGKSVADNDPLKSPLPTMEPLQDRVLEMPNLVVAFTGVMHHSGQTHKSLYQRYCDGDQSAIDAAQQFADFGRRAKRPLITGDWSSLAALMTENQTLIRSIQPQNPANERLIDAALSEGALAAKLAGAGGGGSILALVTDDTRDAVVDALKDAGAAAVLFPKPCPGLIVTVAD